MKEKYIIVKCEELDDQWECDCDRTVIKVVEDYKPYYCFGYEIWLILSDGSVKLVKEYCKGKRKRS
jgi:hypothetical protein